jgi:hypothetical protein
MKPIDYIASNPSIEDMASKALLFSAALYHAMQAKQGNIDTSHLITPVLLTDGRYGICCDILSETGEKGTSSMSYSVFWTKRSSTPLSWWT